MNNHQFHQYIPSPRVTPFMIWEQFSIFGRISFVSNLIRCFGIKNFKNKNAYILETKQLTDFLKFCWLFWLMKGSSMICYVSLWHGKWLHHLYWEGLIEQDLMILRALVLQGERVLILPRSLALKPSHGLDISICKGCLYSPWATSKVLLWVPLGYSPSL